MPLPASGSMTPRRVVLAGGSGFLGRSLAEDLIASGCQVVVLTRSAHGGDGRAPAAMDSAAVPATDRAKAPATDRAAPVMVYAGWDGKTAGDWTAWIDGAEAVVNLAGRSVSCRYTPENRREIVDSRVDSVKAIGEAIRRCASPPRAWVQAGSLAIYGDAGDRICDEAAPHGDGFSAEVCKRWEEAFDAQDAPGTRKSLLRIGFVLGRGGGALGTLATLARRFLGGTVGSGRQYISWLHVADMDRIFRRAIDDDSMRGVYNATGPSPVTNKAFMAELRRAVVRPWSPPVPSWAVRLGSALMGTEADLALTGRRCVPRRLLDEGFAFRYPVLRQALTEILAG